MSDWRAAPYMDTEPAEALLARDEPPGGWPPDVYDADEEER